MGFAGRCRRLQFLVWEKRYLDGTCHADGAEIIPIERRGDGAENISEWKGNKILSLQKLQNNT